MLSIRLSVSMENKDEPVNKTGNLKERIAESHKALKEAVRRYGVEGIALAFNGGKDCCVALHLLSKVLSADEISKLLILHFVPRNEFPEVRK